MSGVEGSNYGGRKFERLWQASTSATKARTKASRASDDMDGIRSWRVMLDRVFPVPRVIR